jgi:quercetin dioxygenase-like cupin family protein
VNEGRNLLSNAIHDLAPYYALGGLDGQEKSQFEEHLRQGCEICSAQLLSLRHVSIAIGSSVPADPPSKLRERLLARIEQTPRIPGRVFDQNGLIIARSEEIAWKAIAPGVAYKPLYRDKARNYDTALVRMDAGAHYPSHRHAQVEELFVLSGDLHVEEQVMYAGDYCRANLDSVHQQSFSEGGCVFLMMASPENQILA